MKKRKRYGKNTIYYQLFFIWLALMSLVLMAYVITRNPAAIIIAILGTIPMAIGTASIWWSVRQIRNDRNEGNDE